MSAVATTGVLPKGFEESRDRVRWLVAAAKLEAFGEGPRHLPSARAHPRARVGHQTGVLLGQAAMLYST